MKIRMTITVEVDEHAWVAEYGTEPETVREDVKSYTSTLLNDCLAGSDDLWRNVTVK